MNRPVALLVVLMFLLSCGTAAVGHELVRGHDW